MTVYTIVYNRGEPRIRSRKARCVNGEISFPGPVALWPKYFFRRRDAVAYLAAKAAQSPVSTAQAALKQAPHPQATCSLRSRRLIDVVVKDAVVKEAGDVVANEAWRH